MKLLKRRLNNHKPMARNSKGEASHDKTVIRLQNVVKSYELPAGDVVVLKGIDLNIQGGEFVAIVGKSGSGKSTLINMVTGIDRPTSGTIYVKDTAVHTLSEDESAFWRGHNVGVIFQFFELLPSLSCIDNVILPMSFCGLYSSSERKKRALYLLEQVGMADQAHKFPSELSGGQQQRIAIARALANDPGILVADEPTGNLDLETANAVFAQFQTLVENGKTIIMVTHDKDLAERAQRIITITDGMIEFDRASS